MEIEMTQIETARRLNEMTTDQIARVARYINEGFGAQSIKIETGLPLRLVNAVFEKVQG